MTFDQWMKTIRPTYRETDDTVVLRMIRRAWVAAEIQTRVAVCDQIKKANDEAMECGFELDRDQCISVIRGTWKPQKNRRS